MYVTVSKKGQLVIPASIRRRLGISAGMRLEVVQDGDAIRLLVEPLRTFLSAQACIGIAGYRTPMRELSAVSQGGVDN